MSVGSGGGGAVPLVDVHAHFLTAEYVAAAREGGHVHPDGMPGWPDWDAARHLELMDEWGIRTSMLSISSPGTHFGDDAAARALSRLVNDAGAEVRRSAPDRFGQFASLPLPDVDGALAELARALDELGCDGVTVESNAGGVYLGDRRYEPLLAELNRRRTPVFVHPTSPPQAELIALGRPRPMLEFIFDTTRTVSDLVFADVFTRYPDIQWIFTHGGGTLPLLADRMELFRSAFPTVVQSGAVQSGDVPSGDVPARSVPQQLRELWFDIAGTPFPNQVPALVAAFGPQRVLYGSDYCWTPAPASQAQVESLDTAPQPPDDTWRALTTRNANRLFPRLTRAHQT